MKLPYSPPQTHSVRPVASSTLRKLPVTRPFTIAVPSSSTWKWLMSFVRRASNGPTVSITSPVRESTA